jgi:hypothetical protein
MTQETLLRPSVSIICVYNDTDVRIDCLDRSVNAADDPGTIEYIPIENTGGEFASAGAALNAGIRQARHDVVVLVHQDVYLHSMARVLEVAGMFADSRWGLLGASGRSATGKQIGRMRDRVQLTGHDAPYPVEVDSLDEVLFMARREVLLQNPLSEDEHLAWHAYAVELGIRLRAQGLKTGAVDLAITHNSLTGNLAKLDVAHRRVAELHPDELPVRTTCGIVSARPPLREKLRRKSPTLAAHFWRYRWMRESVLAAKARRRTDAPVVLSDIRVDVDVLELSRPLEVVNLDQEGSFAHRAGQTVRLRRLGRDVFFTAGPGMDSLLEIVERSIAAGRAPLITDLSLHDLGVIDAHTVVRAGARLVGVHEGTVWLLLGLPPQIPPQLQSARATLLLAGRSGGGPLRAAVRFLGSAGRVALSRESGARAESGCRETRR